jgi:hypothetical protein
MLTNTEVKVMAWKLVPVPSRTLIEIQSMVTLVDQQKAVKKKVYSFPRRVEGMVRRKILQGLNTVNIKINLQNSPITK